MLHFEKWKIALVTLICVLGLAFTAPNFLSEQQRAALPDFLPKNALNLGLDLQGGAHLLMEMDSKAVQADMVANLTDAVRADLRERKIRYTKPVTTDNSVTFGVRKPEQVETAYLMMREQIGQASVGIAAGTSPDREVVLDGNKITITLTEAGIQAKIYAAVDQTIEVLGRRVNALGVTEPSIQRQGLDRVLIQMPGLKDASQLKDILKSVAKMTFHLVHTSADPYADRVPAGYLKLYEEEGEDRIPVIVRKRVELTGENLVDAQPTYSEGQPVVSFRFDARGGRLFGKITGDNVGNRFAIVLDNRVITAPVIQAPILGGTGIITGRFNPEEANNLAVLLRAGALPAPVKFLEERTVGPDLGADNIAAGKIAAMLGFVAVIIFMFLCYGPLFGTAANVALITNLFLVFGALSSLQATLTLPGIAGIVLTIGMAVDANVLIFERIREEIAAGRSPFSAVEAGFKRALTTIVDSNVTTGLAAVILFAMGSGPVRGFAVTLGLGIICSMFTAIMLTRMLVALRLRRTRPATLVV